MVQLEQPVLDDDLLPFQVPEAILDRRITQRDHGQVKQVLIHWFDLPASLAAWEATIPLKSRCPRAMAWGQAKSKGGGNVMTLLQTQDRLKRQARSNSHVTPLPKLLLDMQDGVKQQRGKCILFKKHNSCKVLERTISGFSSTS